jgi:hypothetical protein
LNKVNKKLKNQVKKFKKLKGKENKLDKEKNIFD